MLLFLYAAITKLMDLEKFQVQISKSPILTDMAGFIAWFIPLVEIGVSCLLGISRFRLLGMSLSLGLMTAFTGYVFIIMNFSEEIPCSCGGILQSMGWRDHLIFNSMCVVIAAIGVLLLRQPSARKSIKEILLQ